jgi:hypothetical protein
MRPKTTFLFAGAAAALAAVSGIAPSAEPADTPRPPLGEIRLAEDSSRDKVPTGEPSADRKTKTTAREEEHTGRVMAMPRPPAVEPAPPIEPAPPVEAAPVAAPL